MAEARQVEAMDHAENRGQHEAHDRLVFENGESMSDVHQSREISANEPARRVAGGRRKRSGRAQRRESKKARRA